MELKDFIAKTLSDVTIGINEAQNLMKPHTQSYISEKLELDIYFDITVSYDEKDKKGGEAKITVISVLSGGPKTI